ncbi:AbrB/MazE/SpoVT family DNA-binding domain-containing protein [Halorussus salilacus]|uniref:AbrB/MazE/SpoVT family DNA-binding domain-containing protein n=1 Tax=Halorussus salilacus TaxID=2953750 RepID=UPI00209EC347|nr:AbrB/MazE/SpoVT family DNA-binding domain-containing protein [Halorussus salilacus]USZ67123.1 AbrB/MazE/SpoVT family DNA-binding domain-containing protein [Halorussus salilacus]
MTVGDSNDAETILDERYAVTVPAKFRERLDLEPGNRLRWTVTNDGRLLGEIVRERYGVAEELDPIDIEEETDAVVDTEELAYEVD